MGKITFGKNVLGKVSGNLTMRDTYYLNIGTFSLEATKILKLDM